MFRGGRKGLPLGGGTLTGDLLFSADNTHDIGDATHRPANIYVGTGVYLGGTGAANLLDDYEEGTFTPTMNSTGGGESVTYDGRSGRYTKFGRAAHVQCAVDLATWSGGSGTVQIGSLPFTAAAAYFAMSISGVSGFGTQPGVAQVGSGSTNAALLQTNLSTGVAESAMSGDEIIRMNGVYEAA